MLCQRHITPPHCLSKETTLNPRANAVAAPPPLWAFISFHFGLVGLHFLVFWPCGPSFPCILALQAFISLHFGLVGLHFLSFWPCGLSLPFILTLWAFISLHFDLAGVHFLSLAISLHFGVVGLHFRAFWPCGLSAPGPAPFCNF